MYPQNRDIMRKFCLLIAITFVAVSCNSPLPSVNDLTFSGINGNVSVIKESIYSSADQNGEAVRGKLLMSSLQEFNESGRMTSEVCYDSNGEKTSEQTRTYDEDNLLCGRSEWTSPLFYTTSKVFQRKRNLAGWMKSNGDIIAVRTKGHVEKEYYEDKVLLRKTRYNKDFMCVSECIHNPKDGSVTREIRNIYDGRLLMEQTVTIDGEDYISTYEYRSFDPEGNWTEAVFSDGEIGENFICVREYTYR